MAKASPIGTFLLATYGNQFQPTCKLVDQVFKSVGTPFNFISFTLAKLNLYILLLLIPPFDVIDPDHPLLEDPGATNW